APDGKRVAPRVPDRALARKDLRARMRARNEPEATRPLVATPQTGRNLGNGPMGPQEMHQREHELDEAFTARSKQRAAQERAARNGQVDPARARPGDPAETRRYAENLRKRAAGARTRGRNGYADVLDGQAAQADARAKQYDARAKQAVPARTA